MSLLVVTQLQANDPAGVIMKRRFDPKNPVHFARKHKCVVGNDG